MSYIFGIIIFVIIIISFLVFKYKSTSIASSSSSQEPNLDLGLILDSSQDLSQDEDKLLELEQAMYSSKMASQEAEQVSSSQPPSSSSQPPSSSSQPPSSSSQPPASSSQPPVAYSSQPPASSSQPPVAYSSQPPATALVAYSSQPPASSSQPPASSSQPAVAYVPRKDVEFILSTKASVEKQAALMAGSIAFSFILEEIIEKIFAKELSQLATKIATKLGQAFSKSVSKTLGKISIKAFVDVIKSASAATRAGIQTMIKMGVKAYTTMSRLVAKLVAEIVAKTLIKSSLAAGKVAGTAIKQALIAAKTAIVGTKISAAGMYAALGPVGVAMLAFDLLNLILDAADAGGYNMLDKWKLIIDAVKKQVNDISKQNNINFPLTIGPLDSLYLQPAPDIVELTDEQQQKQIDDLEASLNNYSLEPGSSSQEPGSSSQEPFPINDELTETEKGTLYVYLLTKEIKKVASVDKNIQSIVIESLKTEITFLVNNYFTLLPADQKTSVNINNLINLFLSNKNDFYNKIKLFLNTTDKTNIDKYRTDTEASLETQISDYVSTKTEEYAEIATSNLCTQYKGIMLDGKCMYGKDECNNVSKPLGDYEIDRHWSNNDQRCYSINAAISDLCDQNGVLYDKEKGICVISEEMCRMKGGDPKKLSDGTIDCRINDGQNFFEMVFGSTLVRGLKQIFDPNQYEKCQSGYVDDGAYSCRKECDDGYEFGEIKNKAAQTALEIATLGTSTAIVLAAKYTCWAKPGQERKYTCDPGYDDRGLTCDAKAVTIGPGISPDIVTRCPDGKEMTAGLCYDKCKDGYKNNGATICHADDNRLSYPQPLWPCEKHYTDRGGEPTCYTVPPFDVLDAGIVPTSCPPGEEYVAGLCYKNCKDGYNSNKTSICMAGSMDDPAIVPVSREKCKDGYDESELFCTAKPAPADIGLTPIATCKPGWKLVGDTCIKDSDDSDYTTRPGDIISYWYKGAEPLSYTVEAKEAIQDNPCSDLQNPIKGVGSCTGTVPKVCRTCNDVCGELNTMTCVAGSSCSGYTPQNCTGDGESHPSARYCNSYGRKCCGSFWNVCGKMCNGSCESYSCNSGYDRVGTGTAVTCWQTRKCTGGVLTTRSLDCTGGNVVSRTATRTCPDGYEFDALKALCYPKTCRPGFKLIGLTCWRDKPDSKLIPPENKMKPDYSCNSNRELAAGLCYLKCESGYTRKGTVCFANLISYPRDIIDNPANKDLDIKCRTGYKRVSPTDITCVKDSYVRKSEGASGCPSDRDRIDALCYKKCPADLAPDGTDLGTGYTRKGIECFPPRGPAYAKDKAPCREDTFDANSGTCWRKEYDRGAGKIPYECKSNRNLVMGMCYIPCSTKNTSDIKFQHLDGAPTQCVPERGLAYPKSVLSYIPKTYIKKRSVPYSTPQQYVEKNTTPATASKTAP